MTPLEKRLQLHTAEFSPLPVDGKRPVANEWQNPAASKEEIESWLQRYPEAGNTGILTKFTPAFDIDIFDEDAANAIEKLVRERFKNGVILARFGQPPKRAIPFRTDAPFPKIKRVFGEPGTPEKYCEKLEFLGDGQQIVVHGIHPDTHESYQWRERELGEITREALPYIGEEEALALVEDCTALLKKDYGRRLRYEPKPNGADEEPSEKPIDPANHDHLTSASMTLIKNGLSPFVAESLFRRLILGVQNIEPDKRARRLKEIPDIIGSAVGKLKKEGHIIDGPVYRPAFVNMSHWETPPLRPWAVEDRIPLRQPTLFSGEGEAGKSLIELQLACAHVLCAEWLGLLPMPGEAVCLSAEDNEDELHRRLACIAEYYGTTFVVLSRGLHLLSLAGEDPFLGVPDRNGQICPTPLFKYLFEAAGDIKPKHIGIDTAADVFGGKENDRAQVRQFINLLRKLAIVGNSSVVLVSHPSLTGINSGTGLSGSTAWHNSVKARMYLRAATATPDGELADSDLRELVFLKNNYGPKAQTIGLRYRNGLFLPEAGVSLDAEARKQKIDETFLALLQQFAAQDRPLSPASTAHNYAPKLMTAHPEGGMFGKHEFATAMERLLARGAIHVKSYGPPSKPWRKLCFGPPKGE
jgi:RecA-family ATPase